MKNILIPNKYKKVGWILFFPSLVLGLYLLVTGHEPTFLNFNVLSIFSGPFNKTVSYIHVNMANTIVGTLFILSSLLIGFSKEKNEDEYIANIRLSSLLWAVLVNYIILLLAFIFVYNFAFLNVMIYNMFTVLLIFIVKFNLTLFLNAKSISNEK